MLNKIATTIGFMTILIYLGGYAWLLATIPLWVIIGGVLILAVASYVEAFRAEDMEEYEGP